MLKSLWEKSQTKALAYSQAITSGLLFSASQLHEIVNDSEVKDILGHLDLPHWFPGVLLVLAILTYVAHGHKDDA